MPEHQEATLLADEIPQAIQWHEGMLLSPQHFQQAGWRQEMLVQYHALLAAPYQWGIRRLALDLKLLPAGTVRVLDLEAVMPDGTLVTHKPDERHDVVLQLAGDSKLPKSEDICIYLTVPARASGAYKGGLARYEAEESGPVPDENTGEGEMRLPVLRPRLALAAGPVPPPKFVSMPIAKVRFEDEACRQTGYIPPVLAAPAHSPLGTLCGGVAARLREKAISISEQVRAPSAVLDAPLLMEHRGQMQSLVAALPAFEALLSAGKAHPFALYLALCGLAGQIASLGTALLPPVFSPYDHNDIRASCQEVINFILWVANEGIPETYAVHAFKLKDGVFSLMFEGDWAIRRLVLGLRSPAGASEKDMIAWGDECLIGSESVISSLREKRIRGASRQFVEKDQELVPVRGVVLFTLRTDPEFIKPNENVHVLNLGERGRSFSPLEVVLYVKRGEAPR